MNTLIKYLIKNIPLLGPYIKNTAQKRARRMREERRTQLILRALKDQPEPLIVQIGAHVGNTPNDPIFALLESNPGWRGLFVEPVPHLYKQLKQNYGEADRFMFENAAVNDGQSLPFYYLDSEAEENLRELPYWFDQMSSFDRDYLATKFDGKLEPYIRTADVRGLTLASLFQKHNIEQLDLLVVDAEGFDWSILSQLDLLNYQPRAILFEIKEFSDEELKFAKAKFSKIYELYPIGPDGFYLRRDIP